MSAEGHDCWEECDEGPHGCVCGNDCQPPRQPREEDARFLRADGTPVTGVVTFTPIPQPAPYTPKTHEVLTRFIPAGAFVVAQNRRATASTAEIVAEMEFDRWLAEHDRQVSAVAWDKCVAAMAYSDGTPVEVVGNTNPYCRSKPRLRCAFCGWLLSDSAGHVAARADHSGLSESARAWRDRQGDVWTYDDNDGLMHSSETAPFPREHVEKKWGPLVPCSAGEGFER